MIVCDTSIWIEYLRNRVPFVDTVNSLLRLGKVAALECIFGELLQGITGKQEKEFILECWERTYKLSEANLWLKAGEYSAIHSLAARGINLIDSENAIALV